MTVTAGRQSCGAPAVVVGQPAPASRRGRGRRPTRWRSPCTLTDKPRAQRSESCASRNISRSSQGRPRGRPVGAVAPPLPGARSGGQPRDAAAARPKRGRPRAAPPHGRRWQGQGLCAGLGLCLRLVGLWPAGRLSERFRHDSQSQPLRSSFKLIISFTYHFKFDAQGFGLGTS